VWYVGSLLYLTSIFFTTCHVAYLIKSNPLPSPHTHTLSSKACFCMHNQFYLAMKFCFISLNMLTLRTTAVSTEHPVLIHEVPLHDVKVCVLLVQLWLSDLLFFFSETSNSHKYIRQILTPYFRHVSYNKRTYSFFKKRVQRQTLQTVQYTVQRMFLLTE